MHRAGDTEASVAITDPRHTCRIPSLFEGATAVMPESFVHRAGADAEAFVARLREEEATIWIVKPGEFSNCGNGIQVPPLACVLSLCGIPWQRHHGALRVIFVRGRPRV